MVNSINYKELPMSHNLGEKLDKYLQNPTEKRYKALEAQAEFDAVVRNYLPKTTKKHVDEILAKKEYEVFSSMKNKPSNLGLLARKVQRVFLWIIGRKAASFFTDITGHMRLGSFNRALPNSHIDPKGLRNIGSSCYLNSTLHAYVFPKSTEMDEVLTTEITQREGETAQKFEKRQHFQKALKGLRDAYRERASNPHLDDDKVQVYLLEIRTLIEEDSNDCLFPNFDKRQNDPIEFLSKMNEVLPYDQINRSELRFVEQVSQPSLFEGFNPKMQENSSKSFLPTFICGAKKVDTSLQEYLTLAVNEKKETEHIKEEGAKTVIKGDAPKHIDLSLSRKVWNTEKNKTEIIQTSIKDCVQKDVAFSTENDYGHKINHYYRLESAVVHERSWYNKGPFGEGHYVSYTRNEDGQTFTKINNGKTSIISSEDAEREIGKSAVQMRLIKVDQPRETEIKEGEK